MAIKCQHNRPDSGYLDVVCDTRTYCTCESDDTAARMVLTVDEGFQRDILGQQRFQGSRTGMLRFRVDVVTFFFDTVVGADTYGLAVSTDSDDTDIGVAELAGNQFASPVRVLPCSQTVP